MEQLPQQVTFTSQHQPETSKMFKSFTQQRGFNGFTKNLYGSRQLDWNGIGVQFWLEASSGLALSGTLVDSWSDRVHGIRHLPVNSASRGVLTASDPNFNGNPSIHCAGSSGTFRAEVGKGTTLGIGRGLTIATVHSIPSGFVSGRIDICCTSPSWSPNIGLGGTRAQWNGIGLAVNGDTLRLGTSYEVTTPTIAIFTVEIIFANGIEQAITAGSSPALVDSWANFDWIGGGGAGGPCQIAEILCFPFQANSAECLQISDLLNAKYAIY